MESPLATPRPDAWTRGAGVIAQDVERAFPGLVVTIDGVKRVNYTGLVGVLIEAVKELMKDQEQVVSRLRVVETTLRRLNTDRTKRRK